jgi:mono/diheme cytochrome c family protein
MQELHESGGVPHGWKFTLPPGGDAARGRTLFADLECHKCHVIQDAGFPPLGTDGKRGPELTGMGRHHPAEYFAESILDPNAVLLGGPGYIGPDGRSIMPSYADSVSVTQLLDLVAFLKSQVAGSDEGHGGMPTDRTVGPYRVRLRFHGQGAHEGGHGAHHAHGRDAGHSGHHAHHQPTAEKMSPRAGHLMVFVSDAQTDEPVPYLPVSASVQAKGAQPRTVKLAPMTGGRGFHYGANVTLPTGTQRIVLSIGATTMRVMGADRDRFARPQTVAFDWDAGSR